MKLGEVPVGSWVILDGRRFEVTPVEAGIGMVQLSPDPLDMESDVSKTDLEAFLSDRPVSAGPTHIYPADTEVDLATD